MCSHPRGPREPRRWWWRRRARDRIRVKAQAAGVACAARLCAAAGDGELLEVGRPRAPFGSGSTRPSLARGRGEMPCTTAYGTALRASSRSTGGLLARTPTRRRWSTRKDWASARVTKTRRAGGCRRRCVAADPPPPLGTSGGSRWRTWCSTGWHNGPREHIPSTCACLRHVRSVCSDTPRSFANCDSGLSLSRISLTASARNSGGNGGLVLGTSDLLRQLSTLSPKALRCPSNRGRPVSVATAPLLLGPLARRGSRHAP
jgi:hypothetical protein